MLKYFKKNFANKIYAAADLKQQKTFKWSSNQEIKKSYKSFNPENTLKDLVSKVIYDKSTGTYSITTPNPSKDIPKLESKLKRYSKPATLKDQPIPQNLAKDVYSSTYNFQNLYLNPITFQSFIQNRDTKDDRLIADDLGVMEQSLEKEINTYIDSILNQEVVNKDINSIDHIEGIIPESDIHVKYDSGMENQRVYETMNQDDDFSTTFSEEKQIKRKVIREEANGVPLDTSIPLPFNKDTSFENMIGSKIK